MLQLSAYCSGCEVGPSMFFKVLKIKLGEQIKVVFDYLVPWATMLITKFPMSP
ncbi:hypothetical protein CsatB_010428 [Cannabis sativa]